MQDKTLPAPQRASLPPSLLMGEGQELSRGSDRPHRGLLWLPSKTANCIPKGERGPILASEAIRFLGQPVFDFPPC